VTLQLQSVWSQSLRLLAAFSDPIYAVIQTYVGDNSMNDENSLVHSASVSATVPDWSREAKSLFAWQPNLSLLASLRSYDRWDRSSSPIAFLMQKIAVFRHRFWSAITGAEIPLGTRIGGGIMIPHPNGIVIHPDTVIGPNCLIFQQVTLAGGEGGAPRIGGHVDIGAGAKVLGRITLGNHSKVGANAVVLEDVPDHATAVGIPSRNIHVKSGQD
jgi:serine O-acetyltransferase